MCSLETAHSVTRTSGGHSADLQVGESKQSVQWLSSESFPADSSAVYTSMRRLETVQCITHTWGGHSADIQGGESELPAGWESGKSCLADRTAVDAGTSSFETVQNIHGHSADL